MTGLHPKSSSRRNAFEKLRTVEARLRLSEERLRLALEGGGDGLWDWNLGTGEDRGSDRWRQPADPDDVGPPRSGPGPWSEAIHEDDRGRVEAAISDIVDGTALSFQCEYRIRRGDGTETWVLSRGQVVERASDGGALRMIGTQVDVSRRREAEMRAAHLTRHDHLTGLANRTLFRERLDAAIASAEREAGSVAIFACDLDRFKAINDYLGHSAGDRVLCIVSDRLRTVLRHGDTVARISGDDFAAILRGVADEEEARRIAGRIIELVSQPILIDGVSIEVGMSVGVALASNGSENADEVFKRAEMALNQSKINDLNAYRMYDENSHRMIVERNVMAFDLRDAIRRDEFFLEYQPLIDVASASLTGFEALLRWRHPVHGVVSPSVFIPVAEETNLIVQLGGWALREACREASNWPAGVRVAVNVSPVQFKGGLEDVVGDALRCTGLEAGRLTLEVTETVLVIDPERASAILSRLRGSGVMIALDDFGTGYSSLGYLRQFPFDKIKIDQSFIRDIADQRNAAIVRAIAGIGASLGIGIVAEGVETQEQLDAVRQVGCTEAQGYFFSGPIPAKKIGTLTCSFDAEGAKSSSGSKRSRSSRRDAKSLPRVGAAACR